MASGIFDPIGFGALDRQRRALVAQRNALARQADPNAEQTPFRSGLSRVGAFLQNIPAQLIGTPRATTEFAPFPEGAQPPSEEQLGGPFAESAQQQPPPLPQRPPLQSPQLPPQRQIQTTPQPQSTQPQSSPFLQGTQQQGGAEPLAALREAALGARSSEEFAAIFQRPDLFPDPAAPAAPIVTKPGETGFDPVTGRRIFGTPPVLGFGQGQGGPSEQFRTGITQAAGTQQLQPGPSGTFDDARVFAGPERLTTVAPGAQLAATATAAGSPTEIVAEGRELPVKPSLVDAIGELGNRLDPVTERNLEGNLIAAAQDRDNLQDIRRSLVGNMDLLRGPGRAGVAISKAQDALFGGVGEERAANLEKKEKLAGRIGRTLIAQIKNTSGTAVSDKEREWLKDVSVSLPTNPLSLLSRLEDVITLNDFKLARGTMWENGGRQGKPWLIQNKHVMGLLAKEIRNATSLAIQKGQDPAKAATIATTFVEEKFGISPNGYAAMVEEMELGAIHIGP